MAGNKCALVRAVGYHRTAVFVTVAVKSRDVGFVVLSLEDVVFV